MKRYLLTGLAILGVAAAAHAGETMDAVIANETGLAYSTSFPVDISDIDNVSMQVTYTSTTFSNKTFTDGTQATGTLTVVSFTALSTAAATGSFTMVSSTWAAGIAGSGLVQFGNNNVGTRIRIVGPPGDQDYTVGGEIAIGVVSSMTAANFVTAVNLSSSSTGISASRTTAASSVTITCVMVGSFCNSYSVTSSSPAQISTAAFSGGVNAVKVTIGGYAYVAGVDFAVGASTSAMGVNLAAVIYNSSPTTKVTATANAVGVTGSGVVFTTATITGTVTNWAQASSNPLAISTSSNLMTGGQDNATFGVNGVTFTANATGALGFYPVTSTAQTATNIATAITNSSSTTGVYAGAGGAVVFATATVVGTTGNYALASSTNGALSLRMLVSSTTAGVATGLMTAGTSSGFSITTDRITIASHGFTTALPVLWPIGNTDIGGLTQGTTYFVARIDANTIGLSSTSAVAQTGNYIDLTSSATGTTAHTFTLSPLAIAGPVSAIWQVSDDLASWANLTANTYNVAVASVPASGNFTFGGASIMWDLGPINYKGLRLNVTGPTQGGVLLKAFVHGKGRQ